MINPERLIFWHFFHQIEKELSYERWIDKYRHFELGLTGGYIPFDDDWASFRQFCKFLYLQEHRDEQRFDEILTQAIELEKTTLLDLLKESQEKSQLESHSPKKTDIQQSSDAPLKEQIPGTEEKPPNPVPPETEPTLEKADAGNRKKYFHPFAGEADAPAPDAAAQPKPEIFLHSDEYFPVSRRQMVKAWHYLRRREKRGYSPEMDIPATVRQAAKDGILIDPVMKPGSINRPDTLLVFADQRGSMAPFHEFTRRLIHTARTEGGHPNAPVFYFQNYPVGCVYRQANLSDPIKIKESLLQSNRHSTMAVIISDAGAARGNPDAERHHVRLEMINIFLDYLNENVAHTIWLNPIPRHRWTKTAAELLDDKAKISVMTPVFDTSDGYDFQNTIRLLFKMKRQMTKR